MLEWSETDGVSYLQTILWLRLGPRLLQVNRRSPIALRALYLVLASLTVFIDLRGDAYRRDRRHRLIWTRRRPRPTGTPATQETSAGRMVGRNGGLNSGHLPAYHEAPLTQTGDDFPDKSYCFSNLPRNPGSGQARRPSGSTTRIMPRNLRSAGECSRGTFPRPAT